MHCEGYSGVWGSCPPVSSPGTVPSLTDPQLLAVINVAVIIFVGMVFLIALLVGWLAVHITES